MKIDTQNLYYYFQSVEQDRIDSGEFSKRARKFLDLRDKLYTLSVDQFDAAIETIEKICHPNDDKSKNNNKIESYSQAKALYQTAASSLDTQDLSIQGIGRVS